MTGTPLVAGLVVALWTGAACRPAPSPEARRTGGSEVAKREARLAATLATPDSGAVRGAAIARWMLPQDLAEVSGLALTAEGQLFAHGDEEGRIAEIDYRGGVVVAGAALGRGVHREHPGSAGAGQRPRRRAAAGAAS